MPSAFNVLHVYSGNLFGGVERMLLSIADDDGVAHRAQFALCFEGRLSSGLSARRAAVTPLGPVRLRNPFSAIRARRALGRLLAANEFDAVVCHSIWTYGIFAPIVARTGLAPILFLHDIPDPLAPFYRFAWRTEPALVIANSAFTAAPLERLRPSVVTRVVHPLVLPPRSVSADAVREFRLRWGANESDRVILQASRFDAWKGHPNLLSALAYMRDVPGWVCWIAGAPQRPEEELYERALVQKVEALGLRDKVRFIGHRDDMETTLAACDLYCQPNETPEPFGMVFIEAMYAGKPVVGRALGGALEIVTPECGVLCGPGVDDLAGALRELLTNVVGRRDFSLSGPSRASSLSGPTAFNAAFDAALAITR